jgi:hypothetical protein
MRAELLSQQKFFKFRINLKCRTSLLVVFFFKKEEVEKAGSYRQTGPPENPKC